VFFILNATAKPAMEGPVYLTCSIGDTTQKRHSSGTIKVNCEGISNLQVNFFHEDYITVMNEKMSFP